MLTIEQIKEKYEPIVFQKNPKASLVEYLQYEILDSLFKQKGSENLSFMGGTSIRIVYGSKRFSGDLDIDNFGLTHEEFEKILTETIKDMGNKGFTMEFRFVEKGAYHCYIKFPELLFDDNMSMNKGEKVLVRIDTVSKKKIIQPKLFTLNSFDVYRKILVNEPSVLLAQKIMAIIHRKREKGRDLYDVSYLWSITDINEEFIKKEYNLEKKEMKERLLERVTALNLKELSVDVAPFLMNPDDKYRVLDFENYVKEKIAKK